MKKSIPYNSELTSGASKPPPDVILESSSIKDKNGIAQEVRKTDRIAIKSAIINQN
jgi:hypothetical protein